MKAVQLNALRYLQPPKDGKVLLIDAVCRLAPIHSSGRSLQAAPHLLLVIVSDNMTPELCLSGVTQLASTHKVLACDLDDSVRIGFRLLR